MKNYHSIDYIKAGEESFRSVDELKRYNDLNDLQDAGAICELRRRVRFELVPDQPEMEERTTNGVRIPGSRIMEKGISFYADFVYKTKNGHSVAETQKGACKDLSIKKKLMLWRYKTLIREY